MNVLREGSLFVEIGKEAVVSVGADTMLSSSRKYTGGGGYHKNTSLPGIWLESGTALGLSQAMDFGELSHGPRS